ncbi:MAG TPA: carbohydrate ABC transporter permease, partial [Streptomyces sp.]|nr:carbohydrate ABC transporter permease [Streptomyces sp.]
MTTSELTAPQDAVEAQTKARGGRGSRRLRVLGAGKQLHAGPVTYVVLTVFALVSLAPL